MNSSGIKRGLATTAVTALAVTGIPFIASSASAASTDEMKVVFTGPFRDGGNVGGLVVLETKGITHADLALASSSDITKAADNPATQKVEITGSRDLTTDEAKAYGIRTGYDGIAVTVSADTRNAGDAVTFALYEDEDNGVGTDRTGANAPDVDLNEKYVAVSGTTAGAPASVTAAPVLQSAPANVSSGDYSVSVFDAAGRLTQLNAEVSGEGGERVNLDNGSTTARITKAGGTEAAAGGDVVLTPVDLVAGRTTFTARASEATLHTIGVDLERQAATTPFAYEGVATQDVRLDVVKAAQITAPEVDYVTDADNWQGFGDQGSAAPKSLATGVNVRADQKTVRIDFKSTDVPTDKNGVVSLTATGTNVTFDGGKTSKVYTTTLDANGVGSITIEPDAASIKTTSVIALSGAFASQISFVAPSIDATGAIRPSASTYVSQFGGTVEVTATVRDQFGLPVTSGFVTVDRVGGVNGADQESAKVAVNENGQATFTLTDTKATATSNTADNLTFKYYRNQYDATATSTATNAAKIVYTASGQGSDFLVQVDGVTAAGSAYDPATRTTLPLTDAEAEGPFTSVNADEYVNLGIAGGTAGAPVTVSVDNGALVLKGDETFLAEGSASDTGVMNSTEFRIVGTKVGLTTVTVTSAGVTKTAQFTVKQTLTAGDTLETARNISVSGPGAADSGDQVTFTAVVTDAFGNPIPGYQVGNLNVQVSGPGELQDSDAATNAAGELKLNIRVDDDADSPITVRVQAINSAALDNQFGAAANELTAGAGANTAPGLTASAASATATLSDVTNLEALREAVRVAQAEVDAAETALAASSRELRVAETRLEVARAEVKAAKADVRKAKKQLRKAIRQGKGIKAARKNLREARADFRSAKGDRKVAKVQFVAAQEVVAADQAALEAAQAELEAAQQALEDAEND